MIDFFKRLFDTDGFPPRWTCGSWTAGHGWLHILSDLAIFGAYAAIPLALIYFIRHRRDVPFSPIFGLFALFILCCGTTHLLDATLFWHPWYRFDGLVKALTAVVSWLTVISLIKVLPQALVLPGLARVNAQLNQEIEERKQVEKALVEANRIAQAANEAKDHFLAVLSHELRTPLTPVSMAVEAMTQDPALPSALRADLGMIRRNIGLEIKLIDDLLDFRCLTRGTVPLRPQWLDPCEVLQQVCDICQSSLKDKGLHLTLHTADLTGRLMADPIRLHQILWNVLRNAIKFTPEGGSINVIARPGPGGTCEIRVQDTGIGIPAEFLPHLFQPFEQGDARIAREFGGLGLGLAISRILIEKHGGSIRAESAGPVTGSTFILELPGLEPNPPHAVIEPGSIPNSCIDSNNSNDSGGADDMPPQGPSPATAVAPESPRKKICLLLVEDHADTAQTLSRLLRNRGFSVINAASIAEAETLALTPDPAGSIDLLISDLGLPDGTGCDLMRRLSSSLGLPGIAMSGYGMEDDLNESAAAGFARHLVKPVLFADLMEAIQFVLPAAAPGKEPEIS